jgi:hypothetical protein
MDIIKMFLFTLIPSDQKHHDPCLVPEGKFTLFSICLFIYLFRLSLLNLSCKKGSSRV